MNSSIRLVLCQFKRRVFLVEKQTFVMHFLNVICAIYVQYVFRCFTCLICCHVKDVIHILDVLVVRDVANAVVVVVVVGRQVVDALDVVNASCVIRFYVFYVL